MTDSRRRFRQVQRLRLVRGPPDVPCARPTHYMLALATSAARNPTIEMTKIRSAMRAVSRVPRTRGSSSFTHPKWIACLLSGA